jgi:hypothetical protein
MMSNIEIRMPDAAIDEVSRLLREVPRGAERALSNAINRGLTTARCETEKQIKQVYDLQKTTVRRESVIEILRCTPDSLIGAVTFSGHKIPLYNFGVTPRQPSSSGAKVPVKIKGRWAMATPGDAVSVRIRKDGTHKKSRTAFIARMSSGHIGVFERTDSNSSEIRERPGLSVAQMAGDSVVREQVESAAMDTIDKRVEHEISRILAGHGS